MAVVPSHLFSLCRYTPGRRGWMVTQIGRVAEALKIPQIAARCAEHLPLERGLAAEMFAWSGVAGEASGAAVSRALVAADVTRARLIGALAAGLAGTAMLVGSPEAEAAKRIAAGVFTTPADVLVRLPWPEETRLVELAIDALKKDLHEDVVLTHLEPWVTAIETANVEFANLHAGLEASRAQTWTSLRANDVDAGERFLELLAFVLDNARGRGNDELRSKLLEPVMVQERELAELYRSLRVVVDVDPDTGAAQVG